MCASDQGGTLSDHDTGRLAREIAQAADAIIGATRAGVVTSWNAAAEELLGFPEAEAIGRDLTSFWPEGGRADAAAVLAGVSGGQILEETSTKFLHRNGDPVEVGITASPIAGDEGDIIGLSLLARAGTQRRSADEKFRALLESAPDAIVIVGTDGHIVLVNRQAEIIFGYDRKELLGQPIEILVPEKERARHGRHRAGFFMRPNTRPMGAGLELSGRRKDGTRFPVEISLSPIATEDGLVVSAAVRDASERKRAEDQARHIELMQLRRRQALELHDEIVQGLTVAKMAHGLGRGPETEEAITKTLKAAQAIISQMLKEERDMGPLAEGDLVRERPAELNVEADEED
jgi:PAS domain S-box-containing protein